MATVRPFAAATIEREAVNPSRLELGSKLGSAQGSLSYSLSPANPLLFASDDHVISPSFALVVGRRQRLVQGQGFLQPLFFILLLIEVLGVL